MLPSSLWIKLATLENFLTEINTWNTHLCPTFRWQLFLVTQTGTNSDPLQKGVSANVSEKDSNMHLLALRKAICVVCISSLFLWKLWDMYEQQNPHTQLAFWSCAHAEICQQQPCWVSGMDSVSPQKPPAQCLWSSLPRGWGHGRSERVCDLPRVIQQIVEASFQCKPGISCIFPSPTGCPHVTRCRVPGSFF